MAISCGLRIFVSSTSSVSLPIRCLIPAIVINGSAEPKKSISSGMRIIISFTMTSFAILCPETLSATTLTYTGVLLSTSLIKSKRSWRTSGVPSSMPIMLSEVTFTVSAPISIVFSSMSTPANLPLSLSGEIFVSSIISGSHGVSRDK